MIYNIRTYRTVDLNIDGYKNASLNYPIQFVDNDNLPIDLSEYTSAKIQLKESDLSSAVVYEFSSTGATNQILIDQANIGIITLKSPLLTLNALVYVFDLQMKNNTTIEFIARGQFNIIQNITN